MAFEKKDNGRDVKRLNLSLGLKLSRDLEQLAFEMGISKSSLATYYIAQGVQQQKIMSKTASDVTLAIKDKLSDAFNSLDNTEE